VLSSHRSPASGDAGAVSDTVKMSCLPSRPACVAVEIGLSASAVLSTEPRPTCVAVTL